MNETLRTIMVFGLLLLVAVGMIISVVYLLQAATDATPSATNKGIVQSNNGFQTLSTGQYFYKTGDWSLMFAGFIDQGTKPTVIINSILAGLGYSAGTYSTFPSYVPINENDTAIFTLQGHSWQIVSYNTKDGTITLESLS
jgi:hypothetical protein